MTSDQIQEVIQYLINLGETMATGAYQLALKRTVFLGVRDLLWAIFFVGVLVASVCAVRKGEALNKKRNSYSGDDGDLYEICGWLIGLTSVPLIFYLLGRAVDLFLNPEWNAIKMILDFTAR